ncbi:rhodanese-like domain-containing protein [Zhouia sp. PK063]|uniref:rhodanese-like domain-containing protein n=1 Tax=Zhouia sp. PK063 TaxID=3373602 RepID=UPI0037AB2C67
MSLFNSLFGKKESSGIITKVSAEVFKTLIQERNVQLVDVRSKAEYESGHIKGAYNIDFFKQGAFKSSFEKFDKTKPIYVYCRSGHRSGQSAKQLNHIGFQEIYDLKGGYMAWKP